MNFVLMVPDSEVQVPSVPVRRCQRVLDTRILPAHYPARFELVVDTCSVGGEQVNHYCTTVQDSNSSSPSSKVPQHRNPFHRDVIYPSPASLDLNCG